MAKALTVPAIEKMKPSPSRREIPDGLVSGLYLVVQPSGSRSWAVRYRAAGLTRKHTLGSYPGIDLRAARDLAQRALVDVAKGNDPAADKKAIRVQAKTPVDRNLVEKVVETFLDRYVRPNTKPSSAQETERTLKREIVGRWKGRALPSISRADVYELLDAIIDRGASIQANRTLAALRKMCSWAVERGLIESSPCDKVKAPTAERSRDRVLSNDELVAVWRGCDAIEWPFGPMIKMLLLTGQRRSEVCRLRWSELDLVARVWVLPSARAKNSVEHTVPLSEPVMAILNGLPRIGEFVFSTNGRTPVSGFSRSKERIDKAIERARDGHPLPDWVFHDLRRTCATGLARLGVNLPVIERVLNHVSGSFAGIVGVYQKHQFSDEKRHALDAWGGSVEQLVAGESNVVTLKAVGT